MKQFEPDELENRPLTVILTQWFRVATTAFGLLLIAVGIYFACRLFGVAYSAVTAPEQFGPVVEQWAEFVSGGEPILEADGRVLLSPRLVAVGVMGGCTLLMIWITQAVITTGAKIVYWMGTDVDTVKRVLSQVFGPSVINVVKGPTEKSAAPLGKPGDKTGDR
jgi:hypothetical protein